PRPEGEITGPQPARDPPSVGSRNRSDGRRPGGGRDLGSSGPHRPPARPPETVRKERNRHMRLAPGNLARVTARHPRRTIAVWVSALVAGFVLSSRFLGSALSTQSDFTNDPESKRAAALVAQLRGPEVDTEFVVVTGRTTVDDPRFRAYVGALQRAM